MTSSGDLSHFASAHDRKPRTGSMLLDVHVRQIAAALEAAGDNWITAADAEPFIAEAHPGDNALRDRVTLARKWAFILDDGQGVVACPPTIYRTEEGHWIPVDWTTSSQKEIYRPHRRPDPESGTPTPDIERAAAAQHLVKQHETGLAYARALRDQHIVAASLGGVSNYRIAKTLELSESVVGAIVRKPPPQVDNDQIDSTHRLFARLAGLDVPYPWAGPTTPPEERSTLYKDMNKVERLQELSTVVAEYNRLRETVAPDSAPGADTDQPNPARQIPPIPARQIPPIPARQIPPIPARQIPQVEGWALPDALRSMAIGGDPATPFRPIPPIEGWAMPGLLWSTLIDRVSDAARRAGATDVEIDIVVDEVSRRRDR